MFSVLFVCTGNICRSPLAEQLFQSWAAQHEGVFEVTSAGTHARRGDPMTEQAAALSRAYGADPSHHAASRLTEERVRAANLVIGLAREHRAEVVSLVPRASQKTFTLREFARLGETVRETTKSESAIHPEREPGPVDLDGYVDNVRSMRGFARTFPSAQDDDVIDPYRRLQEVYDQAGRLIFDAIRSITDGFEFGIRF